MKPPSLFRRPEADLGRLPIQLDLRAISLAEGVRAALSVGAIVVADEWLRSVFVVEAGLAALFTCMSDPGGPIRRRLPTLLGFGVLGTLATAAFGLLRHGPLPVAVLGATAALFCTSFARVWGQAAMQTGNLLTVVIIVALSRALPLGAAVPTGTAFFVGNLWAVLLTLVIWRVYPFAPARRAVGECYRALARLAEGLRVCVRYDTSPRAWDAHARAFRRDVRDTIEGARQTVLESIQGGGAPGPRASQALLRLEAADQIFGALIAFSDLLEHRRAPQERAAADRMLRRLAPLLVVLGNAARTDRIVRPERLEKTARKIEAIAPPALHRLAGVLVERLRIAMTLAAPSAIVPDWEDRARPPLRVRLLDPVKANLNWQSTILRHAVRAATVSLPAFAFTLGWPTQYSYWLTVILVLTLQPFFALTWQRALERIGGTVLGGFVAAGIAVICTTPLRTAVAFVPIAILAFTVRRASFGTFVSLITPMIILLLSIVHPGTNELQVVALRALYTVIGGLLAVAGCMLLWPSWEPDRLRQEVPAAIGVHADYLRAVLSTTVGVAPAGVDPSRRMAGMASNNLEASIARALQEPRHDLGADVQLDVAMVVDAALRRMAGRLSLLALEPNPRGEMTEAAWHRWREWLESALDMLQRGHTEIAVRPADEPTEALGRIVRQIDVLQGAVGRLPVQDRAPLGRLVP
jgi:uncharacterized membrane protein YccC